MGEGGGEREGRGFVIAIMCMRMPFLSRGTYMYMCIACHMALATCTYSLHARNK